MVGIKAISSYIPADYRNTFELIKKFRVDQDFVINKLGVVKLPYKSADEETSDLAVKAIASLLEKEGLYKDAVECLIVCTQNPDKYGLPHSAAIIQNKSGLPKQIAAFDISLGCSGYVYGLKIIDGFMQGCGMKNGILVTADPYSKIIDPEDRDTAMIFGDAATATLISSRPNYIIDETIFGTDGAGAKNLMNNFGRLYMNGRQIFNFVMINVPKQINKLLEISNLKLNEIDSFIFHQASRYMVEYLSKKIGIPSSKVPIYLEHTGNTVSSSIPLVLEKVMEGEMPRRILLSGFGVGLSWASMIVNKFE